MPHTALPLTIAAGPEVVPVAGLIGEIGACYDPTSDKALLVGVDETSGALNVYRTTGDYTSLVTANNSATLLSQVSAGPWGWTGAEPVVGASITRVAGTFYVVVFGYNGATVRAGTYVYEDTSAGNDATGPWTLLATVQDAAVSGPNQGFFEKDNPGPSEIIVQGSTWAISAPHVTYDGAINGNYLRGAVYTSTNSGSSWSTSLGPIGWYAGNRYMYSWARSLGQIDGYWYVGGTGNASSGKHYKSADLTSWTDIGALGTVSSEGYDFPLSDSTRIFRMHGVNNHNEMQLDSSTDAPDSGAPLWTMELSDLFPVNTTWHGQGRPGIWNIGPADDQVFVASYTNVMRSLGAASPPDVGVIRNLVINPSGEQDYNKAWSASNGIVDANVTWEV